MALPSPIPQPVRLTYEDLRSTPDDGCRYEIIEGELQVTPSPATRHQDISGKLYMLLVAHVTQHVLGKVYYAPLDVILDQGTVVVPDLLFVASARASIISERGMEGAPDLVVEILSPGTERRDRGVKQQLYARYGVAHYWLVDPALRTLTELVLDGVSYNLRAVHTSDSPLVSALFPLLTIDLADVFPKHGV